MLEIFHHGMLTITRANNALDVGLNNFLMEDGGIADNVNPPSSKCQHIKGWMWTVHHFHQWHDSMTGITEVDTSVICIA